MSELLPAHGPSGSPSSPRIARGVVGGALLLALAALFWPRAEAPIAPPGGTLLDAQGHPARLEERFGHVTLVHFWASWCPPCQDELPLLLAWAPTAASQGIEVVLIAVNDQQAAAFALLDPSWHDDLLFDPNWDVAHRFSTTALPETHVLVDGIVRDSFIGATDWSDPQVRQRVQKWNVTPPSAKP